MTKSEEEHDEEFYRKEDLAAANIGRDDVSVVDPESERARFAQQYHDQKSEDRRQEIEGETEELYARYLDAFPEFVDPYKENGSQVYYTRIWDYVQDGGEIPAWEWEQNEGRDHLRVFYENLKKIDDQLQEERQNK